MKNKVGGEKGKGENINQYFIKWKKKIELPDTMRKKHFGTGFIEVIENLQARKLKEEKVLNLFSFSAGEKLFLDRKKGKPLKENLQFLVNRLALLSKRLYDLEK